MKSLSNLFILIFLGLSISFLVSCSKKEAVVIPTEQKLTGRWQNDDYGHIVNFDISQAGGGACFNQLVSDTLNQKLGNVDWHEGSDGKVNLHVFYYSFSKDGGKTHYLDSFTPKDEYWLISFNSDGTFTANVDNVIYNSKFYLK